jgi:Icc-related predicted phosphoesterase
MKILAFSDLHRNREIAQSLRDAAQAADIVIGAGDFATKGEGLADTLDILRGIAVPVILVAGNHDNLAEMQAAISGWPQPHLLHGSGVVIGGVPFFGLGYEIPAANDSPWNQRLEEAEAEEQLAQCPQNAVLVTHSPPFGVADLQRNGEHQGSRAVRAVIERRRPRLALCGHIHHAWATMGVIGHSPVHNLGPTLNWFEL